MENWRRAGYDAESILPCQTLFARYPDLYLLLSPHRSAWFNDRLLHNPAYQLQQIAAIHEWEPLTLWSLHRTRPGPPPC